MGETARGEGQASTRIAELKVRVQKATKLIGELRESNYSLSGQVAELQRELAELSAGGAKPAPAEDGAEMAEELRAELEALRNERETIRTKVVQLLERIEKLES